VGAHLVMELSGFIHYKAIGKPVLMIGHHQQDKIPDWMKETEFDY
jgi:hypothetical protein